MKWYSKLVMALVLFGSRYVFGANPSEILVTLDPNLVGNLSHEHCIKLLQSIGDAKIKLPLPVIDPYFQEGIADRLRGKRIVLIDEYGGTTDHLDFLPAQPLALPGSILAYRKGSSNIYFGNLSYEVGSDQLPTAWKLQIGYYRTSGSEYELPLPERFFRGELVITQYPGNVRAQLVAVPPDPK